MNHEDYVELIVITILNTIAIIPLILFLFFICPIWKLTRKTAKISSVIVYIMNIAHVFHFYEFFVNTKIFNLSKDSSLIKINIICGIETVSFLISFIGLGTMQTALSYLLFLDFVDDNETKKHNRYIALFGYGLILPIIVSIVFILTCGVQLKDSGTCWLTSNGGIPNLFNVISYIIYLIYMFKLKCELRDFLGKLDEGENISIAYEKRLNRGIILFTVFTLAAIIFLADDLYDTYVKDTKWPGSVAKALEMVSFPIVLYYYFLNKKIFDSCVKKFCRCGKDDSQSTDVSQLKSIDGTCEF